MADATAGQVLDFEDISDYEGADSGIGSELSSETSSVQSWIEDYRVENGRTYHAFRDGAYFQPNDEPAQEHLDISHHLFFKTFDNKLYLAPLPETLGKVCDIGTGTGIWAIDMADEHPEAEVIGTDLSPLQPHWVPTNCHFEIDDADCPNWARADNEFDFVHVRSLFGCITSWPQFYAECLRTLKPGGWIEQVEFSAGFTSDDGSVTDDTVMGDWIKHGVKCFEMLGKDIMILEKMKDLIEQAGFEQVVEKRFKWPIGTWPKNKKMKEIGFWAREHIDAGLENWTMRALTGVLGWTPEEVLDYCARMRRDLANRRLHGIHEMRVVYARKPGN